MINDNLLINLMLDTAILEDIGDGDHSSLACIPESSTGSARLLIKEDGIIGGINIARKVFRKIDPELEIEKILNDSDRVKTGDVAFKVSGRVLSILK